MFLLCNQKPHIKSFKTNEIFLKQVKSGWSIVNIEGSKTIFKKKMFISFSADLDEMSHYVAFHLGFHCLSSEEPVCGFW